MLSTRLYLKNPISPQLIPPIISKVKINFFIFITPFVRIFSDFIYNMRKLWYNVGKCGGTKKTADAGGAR